MTFGYLWNAVRVQGGAYGTGMGARLNGNLFSYSYRDPNLENTRAAYCGMADFLEEFVQQGMPLDDMIIGTLNTIDPLLDPAGICDQEPSLLKAPKIYLLLLFKQLFKYYN